MDKIKIFYCTDHDTHWPVGGATIVAALSEDEARIRVDDELSKQGLKPYAEKPYTLTVFAYAPVLNFPRGKSDDAIILCNGDY